MHRPPNSGSKESFDECIDILQQTLNENSNFKNIIVCGNLNFPTIEWPSGFLKNKENLKI